MEGQLAAALIATTQWVVEVTRKDLNYSSNFSPAIPSPWFAYGSMNLHYE